MENYRQFLARVIPHILDCLDEGEKVTIERHGKQYMIVSSKEVKENYPSDELVLGDKVMLRTDDEVLNNAILGHICCMTAGPFVEDTAYLVINGDAIIGWYSDRELVKI